MRGQAYILYISISSIAFSIHHGGLYMQLMSRVDGIGVLNHSIGHCIAWFLFMLIALSRPVSWLPVLSVISSSLTEVGCTLLTQMSALTENVLFVQLTCKPWINALCDMVGYKCFSFCWFKV